MRSCLPYVGLSAQLTIQDPALYEDDNQEAFAKC